MAVFSWQNPEASRPFALAGVKSGFCRAFRLYWCFLRVALTSIHAFASFHLVSVIERSVGAGLVRGYP